jgi:hypothetical protein
MLDYIASTMLEEDETTIEPLENWLSAKPYWEKHVWRLNLDKLYLTTADIDECYRLLCEDLGLAPKNGMRQPISFKNLTTVVDPNANAASAPVRLRELKAFQSVNALSESCAVSFNDNLTLVYGANGSGKSGIGRLLANACFSRGDREVLPNVQGPHESALPEATFVLAGADGVERSLRYKLGDTSAELKRFAVFDSKSVLIHLDKANTVKFTPAYIQVFDRIADTISQLEVRVLAERNVQRRDNPFAALFPDEATSSTATFCRRLSAATSPNDLLLAIAFHPIDDSRKMTELFTTIEAKKKLDVPRQKALLLSELQNLMALKAPLSRVLRQLNGTSANNINQLLGEIRSKKREVADLSAQSFDDGQLKTIGSPEWRAFIAAARRLHEAEGTEAETHCLFCHQVLGDDAKALIQKYWEFLKSETEHELSQLSVKLGSTLRDLHAVKMTFPQFLPTDAGVKTLREGNLTAAQKLESEFAGAQLTLNSWIAKLEAFDDVAPAADISLAAIDDLIASKQEEVNALSDPASDIATMAAQLSGLEHRKAASAVKDAALEYLEFLRWSQKAGAVGFPGIKMALTKKRTETFLLGVSNDYNGLFNQELAGLGCDFGLVMFTSGDQGNTVREYHLDFAEDYAPSQILSEGEQNACSLADFLTEVQLDKANCGIVFDDPVTSLDHERKAKIAERLVKEAQTRQVIVFTHDPVFMTYLAKHAEARIVPVAAHWMKRVNGTPGHVEMNVSPKLKSLASLKQDSRNAVAEYDDMGSKDQEKALGCAFDYLRSACEALIEELLFNDAVQRWDDHIRVQNLEEAVFDQGLALRIVDLHGRISEVALMHNRSDVQREALPTLSTFKDLLKEVEALEADIKSARKEAQKARKLRHESQQQARAGW